MADLNVKVGLDRSGFQTGLAAMENSVQKFGSRITGILAGSFSFAAIGAGISRAIDQGDQLQDLANRFGVAASAIQEIGNAASLSGASVSDVASAMNKLALNAGEAIGGNEQMAASFEKIGLTASMLQGMSPQDLFMALSKAVSSGALGMEDFAVAQQLAGRGAATLMETFRMGPDAIRQTGQAMGVMSDETIAALSQASDAIKTLQTQVTNAFGGVAQFLVPAIDMFKMLAEQVGMAAGAMGELFKGNFQNAMVIAAEGSRARGRFFAGQNQPAGPSAVPRNVDGEPSGRTTVAAQLREQERAEKALEDLKTAMREADRRARSRQDDKEHAQAMARADEIIRKIEEQNEARRQGVEEAVAAERARSERLRTENQLRGNASDFDPREALIRRMQPGLADGMTSADMQDPVKNTTVQNIAGKIDTAIARLEDILRKAGSFS